MGKFILFVLWMVFFLSVFWGADADIAWCVTVQKWFIGFIFFGSIGLGLIAVIAPWFK